ncbi:MAG: ferredoxin [Ruminococcus sp.]|nr:ferredoxin [Ruminococcus sp.]
MKKIIVNEDACIGCGACVAIDPEHFAFNDEGLSHCISNENLESEVLMSAIDSCPTSAISIKEVQNEEPEDEVESSSECEDCYCSESENCGCCKED